jgi:hypothetical protein
MMSESMLKIMLLFVISVRDVQLRRRGVLAGCGGRV